MWAAVHTVLFHGPPGSVQVGGGQGVPELLLAGVFLPSHAVRFFIRVKQGN